MLLLAGLALTTSFNKFLEEDPKSGVVLGSFYKTESQARENVNYLYRNGAPQRYSYASSAYLVPTASNNSM